MNAEVAIQSVLPADDEKAAFLLARAFRDNPLDIAVIRGGPDRRLRSLRWGMRSTLEAARRTPAALLLAAGDPHSGPDPLGVLLALPSYALPLPPAPLLRQLRTSLGQGVSALRRWGAVYRALEREQPAEPHWYLSLIGVDPTRWRRGIGRRLLEAWLEAIDPERLPSYLETDREQNLAFYGGFGFEVVSELEILETPVWRMWRPPQPASAAIPPGAGSSSRPIGRREAVSRPRGEVA